MKDNERSSTDSMTVNNSESPRAYRILLAEDDHEMRELLILALTAAGYAVTPCRNGIELLDQLENVLNPEMNAGEHPDLIISDIRMPGITGMEILEGLRNCKGSPPMILITAFGDPETHRLAESLGAAAMLDKPFDIDDLLGKIREIRSLASSTGDKS